MSVTIENGVQEFFDNHGQRRARLFKIEPVLAFPLYLTSSASAIEFEGRTYEPASAVTPSAQSEATGGEEYDVSFQGAITSDKITNADLNNGVYRGAKVTEYIVDPRFAFVGALRTYVYYIEDVTWNGEEFDAKCSGVSSQLSRRLGSSHTRQCVADLGDYFCGVDLSSIPNAIVADVRLTTIISDRKFEIDSTQIPQGLPADWFYWGKVQWTLGANRFRYGSIIGFSQEQVGGNLITSISLAEPTTFAATLDNGAFGPDTLTLYAGCDKTQATCQAKFNNFHNFQGHPFVRGSDQVLDAPPS